MGELPQTFKRLSDIKNERESWKKKIESLNQQVALALNTIKSLDEEEARLNAQISALTSQFNVPTEKVPDLINFLVQQGLVAPPKAPRREKLSATAGETEVYATMSVNARGDSNAKSAGEILELMPTDVRYSNEGALHKVLERLAGKGQIVRKELAGGRIAWYVP